MQSKTKKVILKWFVFIFFLVFLIFTFTDLKKLFLVIRDIDLFVFSLSFITSFLHCIAVMFAIHKVIELLDIEFPLADVFRITMASISMNNIFTSGGASGMMTRFYLFIRKGIDYAQTITILLIQVILTNLTFMSLYIIGFMILMIYQKLTISQMTLILSFSIFMILFTLINFGVLLNARVRNWIILFGGGLLKKIYSIILRREITESKIDQFRRNFENSAKVMISKKGEVFWPVFYLFLDWFFMVMTLYFCFLATGYKIRFDYLMAAFAIGRFFMPIFLTPGGIGMLEMSMVGFLYLLGVPLEISAVAAILYRVSLFLFPVGLTFIFYKGIMEEAKTAGDELKVSEHGVV